MDVFSYELGKKAGGGGGGTSDYSQLTNKPKINNVELSGNKSSEDLGLASKVDLSDYVTKNSFVYDSLTETLTITIS